MKIAHIITRMVKGGAAENTLLTCEGINNCTLITGYPMDYEAEAIMVPALIRAVEPIHDVIALIHLIIILKRGQFDIVHTHSSKAGILGRLAAWLVGCPRIIHTVHGFPYHNKFYYWLERLVSGMTHKILCVSPAVRNEAFVNGVGELDKLKVVRSGFDVEAFKNPKKLFVTGTVSRLIKGKSLNFVLDTARINPDDLFLIIGDGPLANKLQKDAPKNVHFIHNVTHEYMPIYMRAFDVLYHPSQKEGLPRVIPQALVAGCDIVGPAYPDLDNIDVEEMYSKDKMIADIKQIYAGGH